MLRDTPVVVESREDIYMGLYADGYVRQRCGIHLHESPTLLLRLLSTWRVSYRAGCIMCQAERRGGGGDVAVIEDVE